MDLFQVIGEHKVMLEYTHTHTVTSSSPWSFVGWKYHTWLQTEPQTGHLDPPMWPYPTPRDHDFEQTWIYTTILVSYFCMCCIVYNSWNCLLQIWAHWTCGLTNNPWTRLLLSLVLLIILWFSRGNISKWKDFNNFFLV